MNYQVGLCYKNDCKPPDFSIKPDIHLRNQSDTVLIWNSIEWYQEGVSKEFDKFQDNNDNDDYLLITIPEDKDESIDTFGYYFKNNSQFGYKRELTYYEI